MKHPAGYAPSRRLASPQKRVQLNLRRRPTPKPDDALETERKSPFWRWVVLVALLHLALISLFYEIYRSLPTPTPPEQFISLLPPGDVVKGTPGTQEAPKVGPTTPAPSVHHTAPSPPPVAPKPPEVVQPPPVPTPQPIQPKPILQTDAPALVPTKPVPAKPKVKVDLNLVDGPAPVTDKHVTKPKPHLKKPVVATEDSNAPDRAAASNPDSAGLSKEQIAAQLGKKVEAAGVTDATKTGTSGSANAVANPFAAFYASIRDQVMNKWTSPNLTDETAVSPVVQIHVEKDGRVPPEMVQLIQSSGNPSYDDSAVTAAKSLGYLYQPLPDGCPPDIPITFKLTR